MKARKTFCHLIKWGTSKIYISTGVPTIPPEESCPMVRVRVWFRFRVRIRVWGQYSSGTLVLEPFPLDFTKYFKWKRTAKLLMLRSDFKKKEVCSKSFTKTLNWNKFLVSEYMLKLVCHCEGNRWSKICCAKDITEKSLNRLLLLLILKSLPEVYCRKMCS